MMEQREMGERKDDGAERDGGRERMIEQRGEMGRKGGEEIALHYQLSKCFGGLFGNPVYIILETPLSHNNCSINLLHMGHSC